MQEESHLDEWCKKVDMLYKNHAKEIKELIEKLIPEIDRKPIKFEVGEVWEDETGNRILIVEIKINMAGNPTVRYPIHGLAIERNKKSPIIERNPSYAMEGKYRSEEDYNENTDEDDLDLIKLSTNQSREVII